MENKDTQVNSEQVENKNTQPTIIVKKSNNTALIWIIVVIVLLLGLTLPFHYIPTRMTMFPKNGLTFSYTLITEEDIESIITRYNNASFFEKQAMNGNFSDIDPPFRSY